MCDGCSESCFARCQLITGTRRDTHTITTTTTFNTHCIALKTHELQVELDYRDCILMEIVNKGSKEAVFLQITFC